MNQDPDEIMTHAPPSGPRGAGKIPGQPISIGPMLALEAWFRQFLASFLLPLPMATIDRIVTVGHRLLDAVIVVHDRSVDLRGALAAHAGAEFKAMSAIGIDHPHQTVVIGDLP